MLCLLLLSFVSFHGAPIHYSFIFHTLSAPKHYREEWRQLVTASLNLVASEMAAMVVGRCMVPVVDSSWNKVVKVDIGAARWDANFVSVIGAGRHVG